MEALLIYLPEVSQSCIKNRELHKVAQKIKLNSLQNT